MADPLSIIGAAGAVANIIEAASKTINLCMTSITAGATLTSLC